MHNYKIQQTPTTSCSNIHSIQLCESMVEWPAFLGFCLPKESKHVPQKVMASLIQILGCHTLPIPCNNQPNQFLAVINDWVNETRKIVESLMGSPFNIWIFPVGPKGLNIPPRYSIGNHAPISLLLH